MALFYTDTLALACTDVQAEKKWWITAFDCKETKVPPDWDDPFPSDVALKLPGSDEPAILLRALSEIERAGYGRPDGHPLIFCSNVKKAHEHFRLRNVASNPIQEGGGTQFFNIIDPEGNVIEICREP